MPSFLHVGCGPKPADPTTFAGLGLFLWHNIEHLHRQEVPLVLAEFQGVMAPGGFALITCPDLQSVAALIAANKLLEPAPARHIPGWGR